MSGGGIVEKKQKSKSFSNCLPDFINIRLLVVQSYNLSSLICFEDYQEVEEH